MLIVRYKSPDGAVTPGVISGDRLFTLSAEPGLALYDLLMLRSHKLRARIEEALRNTQPSEVPSSLLAPIDGDSEVWAAGVTYKRSEEARMEESDTPDIYTQVYAAERPELFFKANPRRVVAPGSLIAVRSDSTWDVPEPELVVVVNAYGEIVGYTVGNDISSRSIEGENPLYLPQAKVYAGSCALGPGITPFWEIDNAYNLAMRMTIERGGKVEWQGETNTGELKRKLEELVAYLFREDTFPHGALLCTGTSLVPDKPFSLEEGDVVHITIDQLGTLSNPVVRGKASL
jgi:2-dehydro-3-deoxy-D-arabinonate dehydratase